MQRLEHEEYEKGMDDIVSKECDKQGATDTPLVLLSSLIKHDLSLHSDMFVSRFS